MSRYYLRCDGSTCRIHAEDTRRIVEMNKAAPTRLTLHPAPDHPDLDTLLQRSIVAFDAMTPEEQEALRKAQSESWVRGNIGIDQGPDARRTVPIQPASCHDCAERQRLIDEAVEMAGGADA